MVRVQIGCDSLIYGNAKPLKVVAGFRMKICPDRVRSSEMFV